MNPSAHFPARFARYSPDSVMAPHHHTEPWFCVVLNGAYEERIRAASHLHSAGHILFCPAFAEHTQRFGPVGAAQIMFRPADSALDYLKDSGVALDHAPHVQARHAVPLARRLMHELDTADRYSRLSAEGLVLELVAAFARMHLSRTQDPAPGWLRRAKDILDAWDSDPLPLEALARQIGRHPVHLAREFRRHFGQTAGSYLRGRRAARAAALLLSSRIPLTEIALICGYGTSAQFSRSFKAAYGITPTDYRAGTR